MAKNNTNQKTKKQTKKKRLDRRSHSHYLQKEYNCYFSDPDYTIA